MKIKYNEILPSNEKRIQSRERVHEIESEEEGRETPIGQRVGEK